MRPDGEYTDRPGFPGASLMSFPSAQADGAVALPRRPFFGTRISHRCDYHSGRRVLDVETRPAGCFPPDTPYQQSRRDLIGYA